MHPYALASRILFALALLTGSVALYAAEVAEKAPALEFEIIVNYDETPELKDWALDAKQLAEQWYPRVANELASDGYTPPKQVHLIFKKDMKGIAATAGNRIFYAKEWIDKHPEDRGVTVHELTHAIQQYPRGAPGWLVEGIADYVRWGLFEPENFRPHIVPGRSNYTDAYQTTTAFLVWLEETVGPGVIKELNAACRERRYEDRLFEDMAGKPVKELWEEFVASREEKS